MTSKNPRRRIGKRRISKSYSLPYTEVLTQQQVINFFANPSSKQELITRKQATVLSHSRDSRKTTTTNQ
jgi:hypothetical protein